MSGGVGSYLMHDSLFKRLPSYVHGYLVFMSKHAEAAWQEPGLLEQWMEREEELVERTTGLLRIMQSHGGPAEGLRFQSLNHVIDDAAKGFTYQETGSSSVSSLLEPGVEKVLFVIDRDMRLVCGRIFQLSHSQLARGDGVRFAGELVFDEKKMLVEINNGSGHYRFPFEALATAVPLALGLLPESLEVAPNLALRNEAGTSK